MNPLLVALIVGLVVLLLFVAYDYLYLPWYSARLLKRIMAKRTEVDPRAREDSKYGRIICDEKRIVVQQKSQEVGIEWDGVEEIYAYKADLFTTDLICLSLISHSQKLGLEIHEEMAGYHDAQAFLEKSLPDYSNAWFSDVAFPAFVENRTLIWKKPAANT